MKIWLYFSLISLMGVCKTSLGQTYKADSLLNLLKVVESDSMRGEVYYRLARELEHVDVNLALEYAHKAVDHSTAANTPRLLAAANNRIGIIYYSVGDYEKTLSYFYQMLTIYEQLNDSLSLARIYNNLGLIMLDLKRVEESINYYKKSLKIKQEKKDSLVELANTMTNLGLVYYQLDKQDSAFNYFKKALNIDITENYTPGVFKDYANVADVFVKWRMYDSANYYYSKALDIIKEVEEVYGKVELIEKMAKLKQLEKNYEAALSKYQEALSMAKEIQAKQLIRNNYLGLSEVYKELGNYAKSLEFYEQYVSIQTDLFSQEQAEKLSQIESNYQILQRENKINLLNKEAEIKDLKLSNSEMVIYWLAGFMVLVLGLIITQIRKNNFKTKANHLLKSQNEQIVEKTKDIMDSILCARNIQQAILPDDTKLNELFEESFVYSKGKDVVSGDFYWFAKKNQKVVIAAVDCTGHGVPAAFLNVLANSLLNQIVNEANITSPSQILAKLNERVLNSLHSKKLSVQVDDGMDIGLCIIDKKVGELAFAGAKRPLYYFHNNELKIVKGDHHAVGGELYEAERSYTDHTLPLTKGDTVYLFTDGIIDQFGGEENKKFMYARFKELLAQVFQEPLSTQKNKIEEAITTWQGTNDQTDDILLIGVRV